MRTGSLSLLFLLACADLDGDGRRGGADCDDSDTTVNNRAEEVCDGVDNDCDGLIDEDVAFIAYLDRDGDGFGATEQARRVCTLPANGSTTPGDCDDDSSGVNPDAVEVCDGIDNDCDDAIDNGVLPSVYIDGDGDGDGAGPAQTSNSCEVGPGFSATATDCDDSDATRSPSLVETCDGVDNDCDQEIDEALPLATLYADSDGDGSGDPQSSRMDLCGPTSGWVLDDRDCDDTDSARGAFAIDQPDNGVDEDCDGFIDERGVPSLYSSVEDALIGATSDDVVQLEDGVFVETLDLRGFDGTLAGNGCARTEVYGGNQGATIRMDGGTLAGLTVSGGNGEIRPYGDNVDSRAGGGLLVESGTVRVDAACFTDNQVQGVGGAIAALRDASLWLEDCTFEDNIASRHGGAVYAEEASLTVRGSRFWRNAATRHTGGAIALQGAWLDARGSVFGWNHADDGGADLVLDLLGRDGTNQPALSAPSTAHLAHVTLHAGTTTTDRTSAIFNRGSVLTVENSLITSHDERPIDGVSETPIGGSSSRPLTSMADSGLWGTPTLGDLDFAVWSASADREPPLYVRADRLDPDLRLQSRSAHRDAASGWDRDGSPADRGAYGGLDAIPGGADVDLDADGIPDLDATSFGIQDPSADVDGDGLDGFEEWLAGTDPYLADSDADGVDDADDVDPTRALDQRPTADAGTDRSALVGRSLTLDASATFDPDGDPLTLTWSLVEVPLASTASAPTSDGVFTPDVEGTYLLRLTADDGALQHEDVVAVEAWAATVVDSVELLAQLAADGGIAAIEAGEYTDVRLFVGSGDFRAFGLGPVTLVAAEGQRIIEADSGGRLDLVDLTLARGMARNGPGLSGDGGAVEAIGRSAVSLTRVTLRDNQAADEGGALHLDRIDDGVALTSVRFEDNRAPQGGALWLDQTAVDGRDLTFIGNQSDEAIVYERTVASPRLNTLRNVLFAENMSNGPLWRAADRGQVDIEGVSWVGNQASSAIRLRNDPRDQTLRSVLLVDNTFTDSVFHETDEDGEHGRFALAEVMTDDARLTAWPEDSAEVYLHLPDLRPALRIRDGVFDDRYDGRLGSSVHDSDGIRGPDGDGSRADFGYRSEAPAAGRWALDADGDGMSDGWEVFMGLDPLVDDGSEDPDGDGLDNAGEHERGTHPLLPDTDLDGVNDGTEALTPDVDPLDAFDNRPLAHIDVPFEARVGVTVTLDGSGSSDPNGDPLQYLWQILQAPAESTLSTADLTGGNEAVATFVPDVRGVYRILLSVDDGTVQSRPVEVQLLALGDLVVLEPGSLEGALEEVLDGEAIVLGTGTYVLPAEVSPEGLTIRGEGSDVTVLRAARGQRHFSLDTDSDLLLEDLTLSGGIGIEGGSIECVTGSLTANRVVFRDNAARSGGALSLERCSVGLWGVDLLDNQAEDQGGALQVVGVNDLVWRIGTASGNRARTGGAVYVRGGSLPAETDVDFANLVWTGNRAIVSGGAMRVESAAVGGQHLTVVGNTAPNAGGGGIQVRNATVTFTNSVLAFNTSPTIIATEDIADRLDLTLRNTLAWQPQDPGGWLNSPGSVVTGAVIEDPRFLASDDYRLEGRSPALDAGAGTDTDGSPADLGAWGGPDALPARSIGFLDRDGDTMADRWETEHGLDPLIDDRDLDLDGDGISNVTEYLAFTFPDQLDSDEDGVPDAIEFGTGDAPADPSAHRPVAVFSPLPLVVSPGETVSLNGLPSLDPDGEPLTYSWRLLDAPGQSSLSPLSPDPLDQATSELTLDTAGRYRVELTVSTPTAVSEPFTRDMYARGPIHVPDDYPTLAEAAAGAAIGEPLDIRVAPGTWPASIDLGVRPATVTGSGSDVTFLDGGGVGRVLTSSADLTLTGLTVRAGFAPNGGGVRSNAAMLTIEECAFLDNAAAYGGAIWTTLGDTSLDQTLLADNSAVRGGAVYTQGGTSLIATNLVTAGNLATDQGGGWWLDGSDVVGVNLVFADNQTPGDGGAVRTDAPSSSSAWGTLDLEFITATGNSAARGAFLHLTKSSDARLAHGLFADHTGTVLSHVGSGDTLAFSDSAFASNQTPYDTNQPWNSLTEVRIDATNPDLGFTALSDDGVWTNDDWRLAPTSPVRDAGNPTSPETDVDGSPLDPGAWGGPDAGLPLP